MTWLVTGANGQLGMAFQRELASRNDVRFLDRSTCDLEDPRSLFACLSREQPSVIINCAAYTDVDVAEENEITAMRVNADAVGEIAGWAAEHQALMVHFSTDYVFNGEATVTYAENSPVNPISAYGRSKAAGETKFLESGARGVCLRTSWLHSNDCRNFLLTMKRLLRERDHVRVVDDQRGVPTTTAFLADITLQLVNSHLQNGDALPRLIHAVPDGSSSWFSFASHIKKMLLKQDGNTKIAEIEAIPSSEFPQPAKRPSNSVMANDLLRAHVSKTLGRWENWHNKLYSR